MKKKTISIIALVVVLVVVIAASVWFQPAPVIPSENFADAEPCPQSVDRTPDGLVKVQPGNKIFRGTEDYMEYIKSRPECVPPPPSTVPVDGLLGGLGNGAVPADKVGPDRIVLDTRDQTTPFERKDINKLDDYEYTRVFQEEKIGRLGALSDTTKSKLMYENITDWDKLPFSSEKKAKEEKEFIAGLQDAGQRDPKTGVFFKTMEGDNVLPPDEEALKKRESELLQTYRPTPIDRHTMDSETERVAKLVSDIYANDPHWEPVVEKVGEHQWQVRELRPKIRKETWEDDTPTVQAALSQGIIEPTAHVDILRGDTLDPYFDKTAVIDRDNDRVWNYHEFNKWTPGLERMFAPTLDQKDWY
jgi:hypothetical protein